MIMSYNLVILVLIGLIMLLVRQLRRAEAKQREAEAFARAIIDTLAEEICVLDEQGTILAVNRAWRSFGEANAAVAESSSEGVNYLQICDLASDQQSAEAATFASGIRAVLRQERRHFDLEYPCDSPSETRWFSATVTRLPLPGAPRLVVSHENITQRKQTEQALAAQLDFTHSLLEAIPLPIFYKDLDGRYLGCNNAFCAFYGVAKADVIGKTVYDLAPPEFAAIYAAHDQALLAQAGVQIYESRLLNAWRESRDVIFQKATFAAVDGTVGGIIGAILDITEQKRVEDELRKSQQLLAASQQIMHVGSYELDLTNLIYSWSDEIYNIYGLNKGDWPLAPDALLSQLAPGDHEQRVAQVRQSISDNPPQPIEYQIVRPDGSQRIVLSQPRIEYDEDRRPVRLIGALLDVTDIRRAEEERLRLTAILEATPDIVGMADSEGRMLYLNPAGLRLFGLTCKDDWYGQPIALLHPEWAFKIIAAEGIPTAIQTGFWIGETAIFGADGQELPVSQVIISHPDSHGRVPLLSTIIRDLSELKRSEQQLLHQAHYDGLTGLPGRVWLMARLEQALAQLPERAGKLAVLFLDLDRFKNVNDSLGHPVGDELLVMIADRLRAGLQPEHTVARIGGDEFVVLLERIEERTEVVTVAQLLIELLEQPFTLSGGHEVYAGVSIGISIGPDDAISTTQLIRNADTAMYQAKARGGDSYRFYTEEMTRAVNQQLDLERHLRRAIERREFVVYYQPQIEIASGQLIGVEALLRWQHPERGMISPAEFIPLAEETGLIVPLGEWTLREACMQMQRWRAGGTAPLVLGVNLSTRQLRQPNLIERVQQILAETGLPADWLEIEITESAMMEQPEQAIATLKALKDLGMRLAVDDFGTGYSSLAYLQRFAIDRLKIDRSFIKDLPQKTSDAAIAATIIAMARTLGLEVLAEGVETVDQLAWLSSQDCTCYQGFLFSRPQPAQAIGQLLGLASHASCV